MVNLKLTKWDLQMLMDILPVDPDIDEKPSTLKRYEKLRMKIGRAMGMTGMYNERPDKAPSAPTKVLCDGCNVNPPFEHRCHGRKTMIMGQATNKICQCQECRELWPELFEVPKNDDKLDDNPTWEHCGR